MDWFIRCNRIFCYTTIFFRFSIKFRCSDNVKFTDRVIFSLFWTIHSCNGHICFINVFGCQNSAVIICINSSLLFINFCILQACYAIFFHLSINILFCSNGYRRCSSLNVICVITRMRIRCITIQSKNTISARIYRLS